MTDTSTFSEGVPFSDRTRLVAVAHPDLIEAMEKASEEFYRNDAIWQEEVARRQRNAGMPEQSLESPFGKALREASTAVFTKSEALLAAGALRGPGRPTGTG
jgi:hypothetical protein